MNRFLAETLNLLNGMVAFVLVVGFTLGSQRLFPFLATPWHFVLGALIGVVLAAFICGMIAYVSLIEHHLAQIAKATKDNPARHEPRM